MAVTKMFSLAIIVVAIATKLSFADPLIMNKEEPETDKGLRSFPRGQFLRATQDNVCESESDALSPDENLKIKIAWTLADAFASAEEADEYIDCIHEYLFDDGTCEINVDYSEYSSGAIQTCLDEGGDVYTFTLDCTFDMTHGKKISIEKYVEVPFCVGQSCTDEEAKAYVENWFSNHWARKLLGGTFTCEVNDFTPL